MYKTSKYNHYIRYNDKVLYFNVLVASSFLMSSREHDRMQEQMKDLVSFELAFPSVFAQFRDWGFIVDEGVDEFNIFKYRYYSDALAGRSHHVVVNLSRKLFLYPGKASTAEDLDGRMGQYITRVLSEGKAESLVLEFVVDADEPVARNVETIASQARAEAKKADVPLKLQVEIVEPVISPQSIQVLKRAGVTRYMMNVQMSNDKRKTSVRQMSDTAFAEQLGSQIEAIVTRAKGSHIWLTVVFDETVNDEQIQAFIRSIPKECRPSVSLSVQQRGKAAPEMAKLMETAVGLGYNRTPVDDPWINMKGMRSNDFTVSADGTLYAGRYTEYDKSRAIGRLDEDGVAQWDEYKRGAYLGNFWFEHENCSKCAYLPLVAHVCQNNVLYYANRYRTKCPVADRSVVPESMMVGFFDSKEAIQAMADEKNNEQKKNKK